MTTVNYPKWRYKEYPSRSSVAFAVGCGTQYACVDGGIVKGAFVMNDDPQGNYSVVEWGKNLADGEYSVIHSFATHPRYLRQGVASTMLNFAIRQAKLMNKQAIRLDIVPTNTPARDFYLKHGFRFVAQADLQRNFDDIPVFCLYELNF